MNFSMLPKVDRVLEEAQGQIIADHQSCSEKVLTAAAREAINFLRQNFPQEPVTKEDLLAKAVELCLSKYQQKITPSLRRVINATGVILHTNLGRALLAPSVAAQVAQIAEGYCNLELNLESGKRGSRYQHVQELLKELTGAEEALVVNNNAAAVMLVLDTFAKGGETLVSRGQLVEIGGSFRIPDIIQSSNATLREVGATNKTHLYDYERALSANTSCLLQVHPSNYHMSGFVEEVSTQDLAKLAHTHNLPFIYDLGSGCLYPFAQNNIGQEPLPKKLVEQGVDVLTFSGDKLLGGPQAGIIVGKKEFLSLVMQNQMLRALRVDKMTLAALEATLALYRDGKEQEIPTIAMLTATKEKLQAKAEICHTELSTAGIACAITESLAPVGGGSMPDVVLPAYIVEVMPKTCKVDEALNLLRQGSPSVLAYIHEGKVCFNLRTVASSEMADLIRSVKEVLA